MTIDRVRQFFGNFTGPTFEQRRVSREMEIRAKHPVDSLSYQAYLTEKEFKLPENLIWTDDMISLNFGSVIEGDALIIDKNSDPTYWSVAFKNTQLEIHISSLAEPKLSAKLTEYANKLVTNYENKFHRTPIIVVHSKFPQKQK